MRSRRGKKSYNWLNSIKDFIKKHYKMSGYRCKLPDGGNAYDFVNLHHKTANDMINGRRSQNGLSCHSYLIS